MVNIDKYADNLKISKNISILMYGNYNNRRYCKLKISQFRNMAEST